ncbi:preprotein translocase subunit YajC [Weissella ceti]|uniref:Preprotein translocase subunit YajC n=1 Tax=Weissella ceti TaxID=759620 RepID=A0ABT3E2Y7_9LACO|nr:preprotein translocase subunit YajC [Weissella ceti]MCW0952773.1 preprotein translocase subunit YajC [Weissella ceti]QVK12471.1 preprotein translocase subunit YajC [Weissella ceti]
MQQQLLLIALMFGAMYFFVIRPQKKRQTSHQEMINNLKAGAKIITIGGLHGEIKSINEEAKTFYLDADGAILKFEMSAIRTVVPAETAVENNVVEDDTEEK